MYQTRSGYDRGVNTFSPEGRLFQVEYAVKTIELGSCALGARTSEGVVLAVEKRITSSLLVPSSVDKIFEVDTHIAAAYSGLTPDARMLVDHARVEAANHQFVYNEPIRLEPLTQSVCDLCISFGEGDDDGGDKKKLSRPFGVALLLAGVDDKGPSLFHTDPAGTFSQYDAHAIGNGAEVAQTLLRERYNKSMNLEEATLMVLNILRETMEEKLTTANVEVATVTPTHKFKVVSETELDGFLTRVNSMPLGHK